MTIDARDKKWGPRYRVFLNGKHVPDCTYADGRRGIIREYVRTPDGDYAINLDQMEIEQRQRKGHVKWVRVNHA